MAKRAPNKQQIYRDVLSAAIQLDLQLGYLKWTVSRLARVSGVSRTLIYYYFGKSKVSILMEATKLFGEELAGIADPAKPSLWASGDMVFAFTESRKLLRRIPGITAWYFLQREKETEVGRAIRKIEAAHLVKISRFFPGSSEETVYAVYSLFFGISFSGQSVPLMPSEAVRIVLAGVSKK